MSLETDIPKHWQVKKLGEVADYLNGRAFKPTEWEKTGAPIIRIQNLNKAEAVYNYSSQEYEDRYKIERGELLYAWSASLGVYIWNGDKAWLNQHIFKVVPKSICDKKYLFYTLEKITAELYAKAHGSGMVHVTKGKFEETEIPIPSLPEQQAIVAKIEELLSDLDNGKQQLQTAQQQLKIYRQSLLKAAFEGKLTRQNHGLDGLKDDTDSDAENKIESVKSEQSVKIGDSDNLPKGWKWVKLGDIADKITDGEHVTPRRTSEGYYLLSARNIQNGFLALDNVDHVPTDEYERIIKRCNPEAGDILISCSGSIGRVCRTPINLKFTLVRSVALLKLDWGKYSSKFYEYLFQSPLLQRQIEKSKKATAQANLFLGPINNLDVIICPIEDQQLIVEELESKLTVCDKIEETITHSLQQAETLRQSILKKAFEGKLV